MQITLNHEEILVALKDYASKIINIAPGNDITIDLKAGRGENGYSATLDIVPQQLTESHVPKGPNVRPTSSGSTEAVVGLRTEVIERTLVLADTSGPTPVPDVPVEGTDVIDTPEYVDPAADLTEEELDAETEDFMKTQAEPTKSLFARN